MHSKISLIALISLSLVACSGEPIEPAMEICPLTAPVYASDGALDAKQTMLHCFSDKSPDDESLQRDVSLQEYAKEKPIMTNVDDYSLKLQWGSQLKRWGEQHCK